VLHYYRTQKKNNENQLRAHEGSFTLLITTSITHLTLGSRVFIDKLHVIQLMYPFSASYGTGRFITVLKRVCHYSLSWPIL